MDQSVCQCTPWSKILIALHEVKLYLEEPRAKMENLLVDGN